MVPVETVINDPGEFRVRKQVLRNGKQRAEWVELRKGVAYLFRYGEVSRPRRSTNRRATHRLLLLRRHRRASDHTAPSLTIGIFKLSLHGRGLARVGGIRLPALNRPQGRLPPS